MMRFVLTAALAVALAVTVAGQTAIRSAASDVSAGPSAISGNATSARHCLSGDAANVHGLGWVTEGTSYTITFDSTIPLATAAARIDLAGNRASTGWGTPDLRFTASSAGSMAVYVGARGQAGCYRYKVEIQQPSSLIPASAAFTHSAIEPVKPAKQPGRTTAISGAASSAKHCVAAGGAPKIHGIGRVEAGANIRIAFESDFDPIAGVTLLTFDPDQTSFLVDDDDGGDLEPLLHFTAPRAGTLALHVGSAKGSGGCYHYQVQIQGESTPAPPAPPAPGPPTPPTPGPPAPRPPAPGFRTYDPLMLEVSWTGGATGPPTTSKAVIPTFHPDKICPASSFQVTLWETEVKFAGLLIRNTCGVLINYAACVFAGTGSGARPEGFQECAKDAWTTPIDRLYLSGINPGPGFDAINAPRTSHSLIFFWCGDQGTLIFPGMPAISTSRIQCLY